MNDFIPYDEAEQILRTGFPNVTREEIAMWVWCGSVKNLGLRQSALPAFASPYQTEEPRQFALVDVVKDETEPWSFAWQLEECFFKRSDIEGFSPSDRWLPFGRLSARWNDQIPPETKLEDFIIQRVSDGAIVPWHPYTRLTLPLLNTEGTTVSRDEVLDGTQKWPGLRQAMFRFAEVKAVEAKYGLPISRRKRIPPAAGSGLLQVEDAVERIITTIFPAETATAHDAFVAGWDKVQWQKRLVEALHSGDIQAFDPASLLRVRKHKPLACDALKLLVRWPDVEGWVRSESPLFAIAPHTHGDGSGVFSKFCSMDKLTADELSITFAAENMLEITARDVTRRVPLASLGLINRRNGVLNKQGGILLGMVRKTPLTRNGGNAQAIRRLRLVFKEHLGISADPFHQYRQGTGWEPRFAVRDNRHAADQRAERGARHVSLNEADEDAATKWLRENDTELSTDDET